MIKIKDQYVIPVTARKLVREGDEVIRKDVQCTVEVEYYDRRVRVRLCREGNILQEWVDYPSCSMRKSLKKLWGKVHRALSCL